LKKNLIFFISFTEPDFPYLQAIAPFQPLAMKAIYCPIETSLNFQQANKLIKELKPTVLVIPEHYTQPPMMVPHKTDLVIDQLPVSVKNLFWQQPIFQFSSFIIHQDKQIITFKRGDVINLPIKRKRNIVYVAKELAQTVLPQEVAPGTNISTVTGILHVKDNLHDIQVCSDQSDGESSKSCGIQREAALKKVKYEWGTLDVDLLMKKLSQDGITDIKMEQNGFGAVVINLHSEDTVIQIDEKSTHIICGGKQSLRLKLRDLLLQCIQSF
jgi:integrator complex subunit 9